MSVRTNPRYNTDFSPTIGKPEVLAPGIKRIVAPNKSAYTFTGTNSYIVGLDNVVIIDPGPDDETHQERLTSGLNGAKCIGIVLTHTHKDHSALAPKLAQTLDVPLIFEGEHRPSRLMGRFEHDPIKRSCDYGLKPDLAVKDNSKIDLGEMALRVHTTPGHCANHIALSVEGTPYIFTGDHVMGWSSTLIADPDGSLADYFRSLEKLISLQQKRYLPGHGDMIEDGQSYARQMLAHRHARNDHILQALEKRPLWTFQLLNIIYANVAKNLLPAALMTLNAHLHFLRKTDLIEAKNFVISKRYNLKTPY